MDTHEARVRVGVLGPVRLEIDGATLRLAPYTSRLLVRLVVAEGEAVPVRRLYRDVWGPAADLPHQERRGRNEVQKRVLELRRALDHAGPGTGLRILQTEQVATVRGAETTYRLVLGPGELDSARFTELVNGALHVAPAEAVRRLTEALALFRGRPLAEAEGGPLSGAMSETVGDADGEDFAEALRRRLTELRETARRELIRCHTVLGRSDLALPLAERFAEEQPQDQSAVELLGRLRTRLRSGRAHELLRHKLPGLPGLPVQLVLVCGDLFDQADANLVIGFTDTFDTATSEDFVISAASVQGQLVDRLFDGQVKLLDEKLRGGLRQVTPVGTESVRDKPRGKRTRYPIGTVVPVPIGGRRVFATAYSQLGNDLVARSGPAELRLSLERLWPCVARYGLCRPVAIPLVGSGLARIAELGREQLMLMIIDTFVAGCRRDPALSPELRIVLRQEDLARIGLTEVERHLLSLDRAEAGLNGREPVVREPVVREPVVRESVGDGGIDETAGADEVGA